MISTKINQEITTYREKFFLGLSIRQLVCGGIGISVALFTAFIGSMVFHLNLNLLGYIIMVEVIPICALGFLRPHGYNFETYTKIYLQWKCKPQRIALDAKRPKSSSTKKEKALTLNEIPYFLTPLELKARKKEIRKFIKQAKREKRELKNI